MDKHTFWILLYPLGIFFLNFFMKGDGKLLTLQNFHHFTFWRMKMDNFCCFHLTFLLGFLLFYLICWIEPCDYLEQIWLSLVASANENLFRGLEFFLSVFNWSISYQCCKNAQAAFICTRKRIGNSTYFRAKKRGYTFTEDVAGWCFQNSLSVFP